MSASATRNFHLVTGGSTKVINVQDKRLQSATVLPRLQLKTTFSII